MKENVVYQTEMHIYTELYWAVHGFAKSLLVVIYVLVIGKLQSCDHI